MTFTVRQHYPNPVSVIVVRSVSVIVAYHVGLSPKITPHAFRHFFAERLKRAGVGPFTIAAILGHKSVETTQTYTFTSPVEKRDAVSSFLSKGVAS